MKNRYILVFNILLCTLFFAPKTFSVEAIQVDSQNEGNISAEEQIISLKKYYPNPVKDKLTVEFFLKSEGELLIKIYDILGNELIRKNLEVENRGFNRITFDLCNLRSGIYIFKAIKGTEAVSIRIKKQ